MGLLESWPALKNINIMQSECMNMNICLLLD